MAAATQGFVSSLSRGDGSRLRELSVFSTTSPAAAAAAACSWKQKLLLSSMRTIHSGSQSQTFRSRSRSRFRSVSISPRLVVKANAAALCLTNQELEIVPESSVSVILLAGGVGKRMGADMPKQYLPLLGQPIALYSFHTFARLPEVKEVVVVCDPSYRHLFQEASKEIKTSIKFALPGKERQDSVLSGLQEISIDSRLACIHDSARPLVLGLDIQRVLRDALVHGAAVLGVRVKATIKEAGDDHFVKKTLNRRDLWEMQTPQAIEPSLLRQGFELVARQGLEVTDDVSIVEFLKRPVFITEGSYSNLKVTTPDDMLVAERILHSFT